MSSTLTYGYDYLKNVPFYGLSSSKGYTTFWSIEKLSAYIIKHKITVDNFRSTMSVFEVIEK